MLKTFLFKSRISINCLYFHINVSYVRQIGFVILKSLPPPPYLLPDKKYGVKSISDGRNSKGGILVKYPYVFLAFLPQKFVSIIF